MQRVSQANCGREKRFIEGTGAGRDRKEVVRIKGTNGVGRTRITFENGGTGKVRRVT